MDEIEKKYFNVSLLCRDGRYARFMTGGIITNGNGRGKFFHSEDRTKAFKFSKFGAEDLVVKLKKEYRLAAKVEPALVTERAPYSR